jgi:transcriptional regulator with XRE-family HTH domain
MSGIEAYKAELGQFLEGFARNVRGLREQRGPGFSQEQLSDATKLHRTEIGRIEQASIEPRLTTLVILAAALDVKLDDLVRGLPVPVERKPSPQARYRSLNGSTRIEEGPRGRLSR